MGPNRHIYLTVNQMDITNCEWRYSTISVKMQQKTILWWICTVWIHYLGVYCWMTIRNEGWFFPNYTLYKIITKILQSWIYFTISITFAESVFSNFANIFDSFDQKFYNILWFIGVRLDWCKWCNGTVDFWDFTLMNQITSRFWLPSILLSALSISPLIKLSTLQLDKTVGFARFAPLCSVHYSF